jgi:RNA polymerase sigma factor (TIGR02999 family)
LAGGSHQGATELLVAWTNGDEASLEKLVPLVEKELHRLAQRYLNHERPNHTLQPTALVNEAYLRLIDFKNVRWQNRAHFIGVSAHLMRRILVDHARRRQYLKRGGNAIKVSLKEAFARAKPRAPELVALDDALKTLEALDSRKTQIVELRFFGGLTEEETAEVLKISIRTVKREWSLAQAWLYNQLRGDKQT